MRTTLQINEFSSVPSSVRKSPVDQPADRIDEMQLERLAATVLSKTPADLAALAETNPMIIWEWVEAFRQQKLEAETRARFWSAAMASLATARPDAVRGAAE
jgi:hypothetical protein